VPELEGIEEAPDLVIVRACTRQAAARQHASLRGRVPLLAKALGFVGHVQTRNRGTIGGSLANADPSAEIGLAALALDATLVARSVAGERAIPVGEFFVGPMTTALDPEDCLAAVRFPIWTESGLLGTGFQEVSARRSDFALVAAAAQVLLDADGTCRRIAISVGGAAAMPLRMRAAESLLVGTQLAAPDVAKAVAALQEAIEPLNDLHASGEYRRRVAGALVERAIAEARAEALSRKA
jgi:CO/xanthine dehydrogenase FAD-binding subunit